MVEMELIGVQLEMPSNSPLLLLRESGGKGRVLPVVIDIPEAKAIGRGVERIRLARPMTHDLIGDMLTELGAELRSVTVTELRDRTFYAELLIVRDGVEYKVSSRPSDAIALAVRADVAIFASDAVLEEAGQHIEGDLADEVDDPEELLDDFKAFLDEITPEDFQP